MDAPTPVGICYFGGVNCKGCKYERLNLWLRTGKFAPVRSRKCSYAQTQNGLPHEGIFTPSRGKSNLLFTGSIYAHSWEHVFS